MPVKSNRPRTEPGPKGEPTKDQIDGRAAELAARVLFEFGDMNFDDLDAIQQHTGDDPNTSAVWEAFRFVARWLIRDHATFGPDRGRLVEALLGLERGTCLTERGIKNAQAALAGLTHRQALALCVALCGGCEAFEAPRGPFAQELLGWAELDWDQLQDQARRELGGAEPAEAKVARADAEQKASKKKSKKAAPEPAPAAPQPTLFDEVSE